MTHTHRLPLTRNTPLTVHNCTSAAHSHHVTVSISLKSIILLGLSRVERVSGCSAPARITAKRTRERCRDFRGTLTTALNFGRRAYLKYCPDEAAARNAPNCGSQGPSCATASKRRVASPWPATVLSLGGSLASPGPRKVKFDPTIKLAPVSPDLGKCCEGNFIKMLNSKQIVCK